MSSSLCITVPGDMCDVQRLANGIKDKKDIGWNHEEMEVCTDGVVKADGDQHYLQYFQSDN